LQPTPESPDGDARRLRRAFLAAAAFAALLWAIKLVEVISGIDLSGYALFPRASMGLRGILLAPLLHGGFAHLIANTPPILVLGTALIYGYPKAARIVIPVVWLGSGFAVWFFARPAFHLGASGLTFGLMFFVFTIGALRWDRRAIALSLAVFLLYGGMVWGILPTDPRISFEYHLAGAVLGVILAFVLKDLDPRPPEKTYSWEGEDSEDDDWNFGDRWDEGNDAGAPTKKPGEGRAFFGWS
jgi:membrane associated rhomboid family serine protease